jgi:hypothetical protein
VGPNLSVGLGRHTDSAGSPLLSPSGRMINCRSFRTYKEQLLGVKSTVVTTGASGDASPNDASPSGGASLNDASPSHTANTIPGRASHIANIRPFRRGSSFQSNPGALVQR